MAKWNVSISPSGDGDREDRIPAGLVDGRRDVHFAPAAEILFGPTWPALRGKAAATEIEEPTRAPPVACSKGHAMTLASRVKRKSGGRWLAEDDLTD
jgi:hypothetical protein